MKMNRQMIAAVLLAGSLALVGCGGSSDSGSKATEAPKEDAVQEQTAAPEPELEPEPAPEPEPEPEPVPEDDASVLENFVRPEFAAAMQEYKDFYRVYVDYMLRLKDEPSNTELLLGLADLTRQEGEMMAAFNEIDQEELSSAELVLYFDTYADIMEMLAEVL